MKKLILLTISLTIAMSSMMANIATTEATIDEPCTQKSECSNKEICYNGTCQNLIDTLTQKPNSSDPKQITATKNIQNLPDVSLESAGATVIKTLLGWSMLFTIIAIVVAAMYYLTAQGKEENLSKAKNIILYLIIGLAVMAGAYGIVTGITQFKFF